jgi:hypothetical protein
MVQANESQLSRFIAVLNEARDVGVPLGAVPNPPTEEWIESREKLLESLRPEPSMPPEEPPADDPELGLRLAQLLAAAAECGIPLGDVPDPLTGDWLSGREALVASVQEQSSTEEEADGSLMLRLATLLGAASEIGFQVGAAPDPLTEAWLQSKESLVATLKSAMPTGDETTSETPKSSLASRQAKKLYL